VLVLFLLAAFSPWTAAAQETELLRLQMSADAMGSTYTVELYGYDRVKMEAAADAALDETRRLDELLSNYRPESEWSEVNRLAATRPVKVSPELYRLLSACLEYSRASEGAFDITVGPLMKVWGFYKASGHLPHRAEVTAALVRVGYGHVHLDPAEQTVRFDRAGVEMDPGGIGKGYAVDRMVEILRQNGVTTALVAGSASSIYGMGAPPSEPRGWRVDIKNPRSPSKTVTEVFLKDGSISTSGSYEKFFVAEGRVYAHIMDPRTGYPAQGTSSVSVVAPRTIDSEAWTKPYFVNGRLWAARHKPKEFRVFFCEDRTDQPCAWLP
jgi:thiamine biosynthesis lipoprotein